jgi:hypothetical protein
LHIGKHCARRTVHACVHWLNAAKSLVFRRANFRQHRIQKPTGSNPLYRFVHIIATYYHNMIHCATNRINTLQDINTPTEILEEVRFHRRSLHVARCIQDADDLHDELRNERPADVHFPPGRERTSAARYRKALHHRPSPHLPIHPLGCELRDRI